MVDVGIGTDTGGSVRVPAALCGVIGFKPTTGIISKEGVIPLSWTLDTVGVLAREIGLVRKVVEALLPSGYSHVLKKRPGRRIKLGSFLFSDDEASKGLRSTLQKPKTME